MRRPRRLDPAQGGPGAPRGKRRRRSSRRARTTRTSRSPLVACPRTCKSLMAFSSSASSSFALSSPGLGAQLTPRRTRAATRRPRSGDAAHDGLLAHAVELEGGHGDSEQGERRRGHEARPEPLGPAHRGRPDGQQQRRGCASLSRGMTSHTCSSADSRVPAAPAAAVQDSPRPLDALAAHARSRPSLARTCS